MSEHDQLVQTLLVALLGNPHVLANGRRSSASGMSYVGSVLENEPERLVNMAVRLAELCMQRRVGPSIRRGAQQAVCSDPAAEAGGMAVPLRQAKHVVIHPSYRAALREEEARLAAVLADVAKRTAESVKSRSGTVPEPLEAAVLQIGEALVRGAELSAAFDIMAEAEIAIAANKRAASCSRQETETVSPAGDTATTTSVEPAPSEGGENPTTQATMGAIAELSDSADRVLMVSDKTLLADRQFMSLLQRILLAGGEIRLMAVKSPAATAELEVAGPVDDVGSRRYRDELVPSDALGKSASVLELLAKELGLLS